MTTTYQEPADAKTMTPVPKSVTALLKEPWSHIDADYLVRSHAQSDADAGITCHYALRKDQTEIDPFNGCAVLQFKEALAMTKDGALPAWLCDVNAERVNVNQHFCHSLQLALHEMGKAWARHLARMEAIKGTPAGRIHRRNQPTPERT